MEACHCGRPYEYARIHSLMNGFETVRLRCSCEPIPERPPVTNSDRSREQIYKIGIELPKFVKTFAETYEEYREFCKAHPTTVIGENFLKLHPNG